jgi:hypothetical protein
MATAQQLHAMGRVSVAFDEAELYDRLDRMEELVPKESIAPFAGPELIRTLHGFIHQRARL